MVSMVGIRRVVRICAVSLHLIANPCNMCALRSRSRPVARSRSRPALGARPYISFYSYDTTQKVVDLLLQFDAIQPTISCDRANCENQCAIKFTPRNGRILATYACKLPCSFTRSVLWGSIFNGSKLKLSQIWHVIIGYIQGFPLLFGNSLDVTITTMSVYNTSLNESVRTILSSPEYAMVGGEGIRVQADETYLIAKQAGNCKAIPSNMPDGTKNAIWVVGGIVEGTNEVWAEVVKNRKKETMEALFRRRVREGSILITDGHPSYPHVARKCGYEHRVVVHKKALVNDEGDHTNQIESFWSYLGAMNKGVNRGSAALFVNKVVFHRRFLSQDQPAALRILLGEAFNGQIGEE